MTLQSKTLFWGGFIVVLSAFLWAFGSVLMPFILGALIAYMLNPIMVKLTRNKIPRTITALFILLTFFLVLGIVFALIMPIALRQAQMLIDNAPVYLNIILDYLRPHLGWLEIKMGQDPMIAFSDYIKNSGDKIAAMSGGIMGGIASGGRAIFGFMATLIFTPIVAYFMMKEWQSIVIWVEGLYPRQHETVIRRLLKQIDKKISGFIRGQITVAFCLGIFYALALTIAGLNYGFLIGFLAGVFSIIPMVGSTIGLIVAVAIAWFDVGDIGYVALIAAIFAAGQFIEGNFLTPKVLGDSVGLHPLWIMFSLFAGGALFGVTGMLIAIPVAAIVGVLAGFSIEQYKLSTLYTAQPDTKKVKQ